MYDKSTTSGLAVAGAGKAGSLRPRIADECCHAVLKAINTVAFEYNLATLKEHVSPFIGST